MKRGRERIKKTGVPGATPAGNPGNEKGPPGSQRLDREAQHVKRRRATLPHPLECSTIAAPGLSYRVRNGTGRLTRAMTTAKPRSRNDNQNMAAIPAIQLSCGGLGTG